MVGRDARGAEPRAGQLEPRRVVAEEVVGVAGRGHRELEVRERLLGRLAEPHAVAALRDDEVHHRRRPLPAWTVPTIVGYGRPSAVISGSVSSPLRHASSASSARTMVCRLSSAETPSRRLLAWAARPGHGQPERDRAGVGDDDVEHRRLRDDRHVARRPRADRGERPLAAVLLGGHQRDDQLPGQRRELPARPERPHGGEDRRDAALHVVRAAPVQLAVADLRSPRVRRPRREIARGHDVGVAAEHEPRAARPARAAHDDRQRLARDLLARPRRVVADVGGVGVEHLHHEAGGLEPVREHGRELVLAPGGARDADERRSSAVSAATSTASAAARAAAEACRRLTRGAPGG